jgi:hypothetical protein
MMRKGLKIQMNASEVTESMGSVDEYPDWQASTAIPRSARLSIMTGLFRSLDRQISLE